MRKALATGVVLLLASRLGLAGAGIATMSLKATRSAVLNDGRDSTEVIAEVRDSTGAYISDGTSVTFSTDLGTFTEGGATATAQTRSGSARVRLASQRKGTANVTATAPGGAFQKCEVVFTDDPSETCAGNSYMSVQSPGALVYCAGEKVIEASKKGATDDGLRGFQAVLVFRNIQITADSLQVDCNTSSVRANGAVVLRRGQKSLKCGRLYYQLMSGEGYAVAEVADRLRPVSLKGPDLATEVQEKGIVSSIFEFADLSDEKLVISARQILYFPGEKLQFKRPKFYQDGQQLFAMPFYTLSLYSTEMFSDQLMTVGSSGFGMDLPLYYDLTPTTTGLFRVRYGEQVGLSSMATRPGLSLDLVQSYSASGTSRRFTGEFGLTGINRSDWGFRWTHSHDFGGDTRVSAYIDLPQHHSIYGTSNLSKRLGNMLLGVNLSANRSLSGYSFGGSSAETYLETVPRRIGKTGYSVAYGATATSSTTVAGAYRMSGTTEGLQTRVFSDTFRVDKQTTLTNYFTMGRLWGTQGSSGATFLSSLAMQHSFGRASTMQMSYDFTQQPGYLTGGGHHRMSMSFNSNGGAKWHVMTQASRMLDSGVTTLLADMTYNFARRWRVNALATAQTFLAGSYRDYQLGVSRSVGGRDLQLFYSTYSHRFFFDLEASRF